MSEQKLFKDYYDEDLARGMAARITAVYPQFNGDVFVRQIGPQLEGKELKARTKIFTEALHTQLPADFPAAWAILEASLDEELTETAGVFNEGWHYWPIAQFIELYGLDDFEVAMQGMYEITKRHTAEFAIRPYLVKYPAQTLAVLHEWANDKNPHVRRLVSEGTRPRLPWGMRLQQFIDDPSPTLALLDKLKDDPSDYVRRSVANHLNDITKDNPERVLQTLKRWNEQPTPERAWITRHALRSMVKAGNPEALRLLGYEDAKVHISGLSVLPAVLQLGETLMLEFVLHSDSEEPQQLVVDYVVHFVKANGRTAPKVFKLKNVTLAAGEAISLHKKQTIKPITTRTYYEGTHRVEIQVNGKIVAGGDFTLVIG